MIANFRKLFHAGIQYVSTKTIDDEYIAWLTLANAGMLTKGNVYSMRYAIENLPSTNPVLEIGSFCGLSTNVISYLLAVHKKENKIINCDKWLFEGAEDGGNVGNSHISHDQYREYVKSSYMRNVELFSQQNKPYTIEEISDDFFALWQKSEEVCDVFGRKIELGGKISFCYIDGNHTYEFARRDFDNVDQHLDLGGFILFDDSSDTNPCGLTRLMKEVRNMGNYELVMKNPNYLFKKIV